MKTLILLFAASLTSWVASVAAPVVDQEDYAESLGGWKKKDSYIDYSLSGADYRTYKPEISPTPDGGIFVSIRIDHQRGWLSSDDHATLELTVNSKGVISTAQSTIAIQGQSIASDVIVGTNVAGTEILKPQTAVQIGTDLVSNLTAKLLLQNIVEAGRVSFPAVIRHNYNYLYQAIRLEGVVVEAAVAVPGASIVQPPPVTEVVPAVTPTAPVIPVVPTPVTTPAPATPTPATPEPPAPAVTPPADPAAPAPPAPPASATLEPAPPGSAPLEIKPY